MPEPLDAYSDQFHINVGPYGCVLNFAATQSQPPPQGAPPQADRVATIRMSIEHLKVMTYILRRQVITYERQLGVRVPLPVELLNNLRIGREDWDGFWRHGEDT